MASDLEEKRKLARQTRIGDARLKRESVPADSLYKSTDVFSEELGMLGRSVVTVGNDQNHPPGWQTSRTTRQPQWTQPENPYTVLARGGSAAAMRKSGTRSSSKRERPSKNPALDYTIVGE
jgi:hypothetical protein